MHIGLYLFLLRDRIAQNPCKSRATDRRPALFFYDSACDFMVAIRTVILRVLLLRQMEAAFLTAH